MSWEREGGGGAETEDEASQAGKYQQLPALLQGTLAFTYRVSQQGKEECESTKAPGLGPGPSL